jgi:ribosomal protein S18 acetylase RimI-like enzyme
MESDSGERSRFFNTISVQAKLECTMSISVVMDNPVWHALMGPHAEFAFGRGLARHYPRDMAPFSAIGEPSDEAYADLARDLPVGLEARLFRPADESVPPGWEAISARPILQMLNEHPRSRAGGTGRDDGVISLGAHDTGDMLELAETAQPGPFGPRTGLLGRYVGMRREGRLVAMAGERLRLAGFVELSGICTHPSFRGLGLASVLTDHLVREALQRGEVPFLHVFPNNPAAVLYEHLGFRTRAQLFVLWRRPRGD